MPDRAKDPISKLDLLSQTARNDLLAFIDVCGRDRMQRPIDEVAHLELLVGLARRHDSESQPS